MIKLNLDFESDFTVYYMKCASDFSRVIGLERMKFQNLLYSYAIFIDTKITNEAQRMNGIIGFFICLPDRYYQIRFQSCCGTHKRNEQNIE